jgi:PAS domain-containing protein
MRVKRHAAQNKAGHVNKKRRLRRDRKITASADPPARELIRVDMKSKQATARAPRKLSANWEEGKMKRSASAPVFRHPKTELEAVIQPFDLVERQRFEEKVQRSVERYRTLFDLVPVAVYTCDANGVIREYNRRAAKLWGREPGRNGEKPRFCGSYKIYYHDGR